MKIYTAVIGFLLVLHCSVVVGDDTAKLLRIRSSIERQLLPVDSFSVEYVCTYFRPPTLPSDQPFNDKPEKWKWLKDGQRERLEMERQEYPERNLSRQISLAIDGDVLTEFMRPVGIDTHKSGPQAHGTVVRSNRIDELHRVLSPVHFYGLRLFSTQQDLLTLLAEDSARILGEEQIGANLCVHIQVEGEYEQVWNFWLAPEYDYLPLKMQASSVSDTPDGPISRLYSYIVNEYKPLTNKRDGGKYYFPWAMEVVSQEWTESEIQVVTAMLGEELDQEDLVLSIPDGVILAEMLDGKVPTRSMVGENALENSRHQIKNTSVAEMRNISDVDARPKKRNWANIIAWGIVVFCCVSLSILWLKRREYSIN